MRRLWRLTVALSAIPTAVILAPAAALANCTGFASVTASVAPAPTIASYDPFATGDALLALVVTVTNASNAQCDAAVSFKRPASASAAMSLASDLLSYSVEGAGGNSLTTTAGYVSLSSPAASNRVDFIAIPRNSTATATITLRVPTSQVVSAGTYNDSGISLELIGLDNQNRPNRLIRTVAFAPQATVISKCSLPAPSSTTLNFTSAISNGHPNAGIVQRTTFSNVACTAPTRLRLAGAALQPVPATPARAGFDNFINFRAAGTFGSANSTLVTTTTSASVDSVTKNVASGATTNGTIDVDVNLVDGNPIIAGSYTGTLRVSIDPVF